MKYYKILSDIVKRDTTGIISTGGYLVMVESENEAKAIIEKEEQFAEQTVDCYETNFRYVEICVDEYIDFQEKSVLRRIKDYYLDTVYIDDSLTVREYNKLRNTKDNEAIALDYYQKRLGVPMVSFDCLYREDSKIKDKKTLKAMNKKATKENNISNSGSTLGDMFSDFFNDLKKSNS